MAALILLFAVCAQASAVAPAEQAPAEIAAWPGDLNAGLALLAQRVEAGEPAEITALADQLATAARARALAEGQRARVLFDTGLARARAGALEGALADLHSAAGLAGPGDLRGLALYAAGTARLERAELLRRDIPELAKELGLPAPPQSEDPGAPDALDVARQAYLAARAALCERLALDWRDLDTRANLELVTRRLRQLEELERAREQEQQRQQPQDSQQDPQQQEPQDPAEQPPSDSGDQQQESSSDDPGQPSEDQQPPEQPAEPEESETSPPEPQEGTEAEPETSEESQEPQPQPGQIEERVLSKEEVQQLLDQLAQIEEQARAVRARLRERQRKPVEKDW